MWSAFFGLSILPEICLILFRFRQFWVFKKKLNLNEILNISGKNDSAKKADHILEIQELGEFCGHCFKNQTCSKG